MGLTDGLFIHSDEILVAGNLWNRTTRRTASRPIGRKVNMAKSARTLSSSCLATPISRCWSLARNLQPACYDQSASTFLRYQHESEATNLIYKQTRCLSPIYSNELLLKRGELKRTFICISKYCQPFKMVEQVSDFKMPEKVVSRLLKDALPEDVSLTNEAKNAACRCAGIFILQLSMAAAERAQDAKRRTLDNQDVIKAAAELGLSEYTPRLVSFAARKFPLIS